MKAIILLVLSFSIYGQYIVIENKVLPHLSTNTKSLSGKKASFKNNNYSVMKVTEADMGHLSHDIHEDFHACGGFFGFSSKAEAKKFAKNLDANNSFAKERPLNLSLSRGNLVSRTLESSSEGRIIEVITKLSSFHNRHYKSEHGVESQNWLKSHWESITKHRKDIKVEFIYHDKGLWSKRKQPSIILTIEGSEKPEEIVVVGGHADSINSDGLWAMGHPAWSKNKKAPGADDNASGIASITEALYLLVKNNYKPKRTLQFMAYASEEAGLLGSRDIAKKYRKAKKNVVGVIQLDMTNFQGDKVDINFVQKNTNKDLNQFASKLIDSYISDVSWGYTDLPVGASSDHASWTANGFPAIFPFEAPSEKVNPHIHTEKDTIESAGGGALHAEKFAKLAVAFAIEMAK